MFQKSKKLDNVCYDLRGPVTEAADAMIAKGMSIIKLNTGNPASFGFNAPKELLQTLIEEAGNAEGYSESRGIKSAREAILEYAKIKKIPNVTMEDIYTGNGVSELISLSLQALLNSGDEILIPSPDYPLWTASATLAGGTAVHYLCDEQSEWYPDIMDIKRKITSKTKAIVIINPNNPTGALYPEGILQKIVDVAREHNLIIFSDEIYDRLVLDGLSHTSIASLAPDLFTITFNGLSKSHMIAGFRCGWMCLGGNKELAKNYIEGIHILASMRLCSNVLSQSVIKMALDDYGNANKYLEAGGRIYEQREFIINALKDIPGISVVKPKAAFYAFPKIDTKKFNIIDDEKFLVDFLNKEHVLMTHGGGFHWEKPDHFRVIYLSDIEELDIVAKKLKSFLSSYRQV
jgi:Aspartate/tyrosine/aromatic aminotransferase